MHDPKKPTRQVLFYLILAIQIPWAFVLATTIMPRVDPLRLPVFDLTTPFAQVTLGIAEAGGPIGAGILTLVLIGIIIFRPGLQGKRRLKEGLVILLTGGLFLAGGALLNEYVLKPYLGVPRPNIIELAKTPDADGTVLDRSAEAFYTEFPTKEARSTFLESISSPEGFEGIPMTAGIRHHWVKTTGFSQPSGHAMNALLFMVLFLGMALSYLSGRRKNLFYLLIPWAILVCYSRPILRVHSPVDITLGAIQGAVLGLAAVGLIRWILDRHSHGP